MDAELSTKLATGKWWTWGNIKKNQWGNLQASFKVTPALIELFQSKQGSWVNFSVFEEEPKVQEHDDSDDLDAPF